MFFVYEVTSFHSVPPLPGYQPATSWVHYTTSCNNQSSSPEDLNRLVLFLCITITDTKIQADRNKDDLSHFRIIV